MEFKMNKITWPSSEKVMNNLVVVLLAMVILMFFLYAVDGCWTFILERLY